MSAANLYKLNYLLAATVLLHCYLLSPLLLCTKSNSLASEMTFPHCWVYYITGMGKEYQVTLDIFVFPAEIWIESMKFKCLHAWAILGFE